MRHSLYRSAVFVVASLALVAASDTAAARGHGGGGHSGSHHHHHFAGGGAFFFGATAYPYPWPGYYPYPSAMPYDAPPPVYVEQYPGTPAPGTQDWIYCPGAGASYPDAQECPGGWQRIIPTEPAPAAGS
jgi:hypothetical protein